MDQLVSIVSINYNQKEHTIEFLDSLFQSDYKNIEIVLVDNASKDPLDKELESRYKNLKCILLEENLGFAGGNNIGIDATRGDYVIFLNNDTIVPPTFVSTMVEFMKANPQVGIASPKVLYPDGLLQYAGATRVNPFTGRGKIVGFQKIDEGQYDKNYVTDLPHGAAMIVPRKVIHTIGKIPEDYFLYYEELDWCMQIRRAGYQMFYVGITHIYHKESISVGQDSPLKVYYMNRNRIIFQKRNTNGIEYLSSLLFYLIIAFPKATMVYLFSGKTKHLISLWRGLFWHINKRYVFKSN